MTEIPLQQPWGKKWCCNPQILHQPCNFFSLAPRVLNVPSLPHSSTSWSMCVFVFLCPFCKWARAKWMCASNAIFFFHHWFVNHEQAGDACGLFAIPAPATHHSSTCQGATSPTWSCHHYKFSKRQALHEHPTMLKKLWDLYSEKWVHLNPINCHHHCYPWTQDTRYSTARELQGRSAAKFRS